MNESNQTIKGNDQPKHQPASRGFPWGQLALILFLAVAMGSARLMLHTTRPLAVAAIGGKASVAQSPMKFYYRHGLWKADLRSLASAVQFVLTY